LPLIKLAHNADFRFYWIVRGMPGPGFGVMCQNSKQIISPAILSMRNSSGFVDRVWSIELYWYCRKKTVKNKIINKQSFRNRNKNPLNRL